MLQKFAKKLHKAGFDAQVRKYQTGCYYDGTEHGYYYDMLYVSPESWTEHEIALKAVKRMLRGALKDEYIIEPIVFSQAFHVISRKDAQQARRAGEEGRAFLDGFWQAIHNDPTTRENNAAKAIKAGQEAVKAWKEGQAAS